MSAATSSEIRAQLDSLADHLAELENEASSLSYSAVSGDSDAAKRLAEINREISRARVDQQALRRAHAVAVERESNAADATAAAGRAAALNEAQAHAGQISSLAAKADELIAQFAEVAKEIDAAERAAHTALRRAGVSNPGFVGSNGLTEFALTRFDVTVRGARRHEKRTVAEIARSAWRFLLELENDETEAA